MSDTASIARPYAQAVFELAKASGHFEQWSEQLALLSEVAEHADFKALIGDPRITRDQVETIIFQLTEDALDEQARNFVKILSHYRRLSALPLITRQYEALRAEDEGIVEAELETAFELSSQQCDELTKALESHLGRKVRLSSEINSDLVGGAVVRAGDWVIDGSIRAQLNKLASSLGV